MLGFLTLRGLLYDETPKENHQGEWPWSWIVISEVMRICPDATWPSEKRPVMDETETDRDHFHVISNIKLAY